MMEPDTYTIIPDSFLDLDLTITETVILSVIHGFCQDGESDFHGSYTYLARKAKIERRSAMRIVARLEAKGLVRKEIRDDNGVKTCSMRTSLQGGDLVSPVVTECHRGGDRVSLGGGDRVSPNNIDIENIRKIKNISPSPSFDFLKSLKALGVSDQLARDWMAVRKTKRATNTKTAFDRIKAEFDKSGHPAEDCVRLAVENSWSGFKAEWMAREEPGESIEDINETLRRLNDGTYTR
jgi:hypothetical protein